MKKLALIALLFAKALHGQTVDQFAKVLLPVVPSVVDGGGSSRWISEVWVRNDAATDVLVIPGAQCIGIVCPIGGRLPKKSTVKAQLWRWDSPPTRLINIERVHLNKIWISLHVRDGIRNLQSAGVEVPVVPEDDFFTETINLLNVPLHDRFRQTLRVYALPQPGPIEVEVTFHSMANDSQLHTSRRAVLETYPALGEFHTFPAYVELHAIRENLPELVGEQAIRIEIRPITPGIRIWAMASITNNETHEVTIVTPQTPQ